MFHSFMHIALEQAKKAYTLNEVPVGGVIVNAITQQIVAKDFNRMRTENNPLLHVEIILLQALYHNNVTSACYDLYVTLEPCPMCILCCKCRKN